MTSQNRESILARIDTRTKVLALVALVIEATFLGSLFAMPPEWVFWSLLVCASTFVVLTVGIVVLELASPSRTDDLQPSPLTPDSPLLTKMVTGAVHTVCRGVTVPKTPEEAQLRAFIFKKQGQALVCTHFWAPESMRVMEEVGLTFPLDRELEDTVAVVRAYFTDRPARMPIHPASGNVPGLKGAVDERLKFVLAVPIRNEHGIWGVVDLDSTNDIGAALLASTVSDNVLFHLAEHLWLLFSLCEPGRPPLRDRVLDGRLRQ